MPQSPYPVSREEIDHRAESVVLGHAARTMSRYKYPILVAIVAAALLFAIGALAMYLLAPAQRITTLPFRLEFEGAERGEYPNGTKFSSAEIIATPILTRVYQQNRLNRFISFKDFSDAIFVVESNAALDQLAREYEAKLSDPKLNAVDRDRLEKEFDLKRQSLSRSEYSVNFTGHDKLRQMPQALVAKVLSDILRVWAQDADETKGVLQYRIPVVTEHVLDRTILSSDNEVVTLDLLRTRVDTVIRNIDALLTVPGAEVLRTSKRVSLTETRLRLEDLIRFSIQPLLLRLVTGGGYGDRAVTVRYLQSQLEHNELRAQSAEQKVATLRESLSLYLHRPPDPDLQAGGSPTTSTTAPNSVVPQISESFLDRLVELSRRGDDLQYRQDLVEDITKTANEGLPHRMEVRYYTELLDRLGASGGAGLTGGERATVQTQIRAVFDEITAAIRDVNAIYAVMSRNLNPSTNLYTHTGPYLVRTQRGVSVSRLALFGVLWMLIATPLVVLGVLLHNRIREEEVLEDQLMANQQAMAEETIAQPDFSSTPAVKR